MLRFLPHHGDLARRVAASQTVRPARSSVVLVPDTRAAGVAGLLLAGDVAGCVDPLGRDGIWMAMLGGQLAADALLVAIETGEFTAAVGRLGDSRRVHLGSALRDARIRQRLLNRPMRLAAMGAASRLFPRVLVDVALGSRRSS